ncbi:MAG: class I SAM-dependent methyltransferase [Syntrophomonas sp.]|nr:class I SAM-dependent methyltransferase [Syntrophomonas sp.]
MNSNEEKQQDIKRFWNEQAQQYGELSKATLPDDFVKTLEVENIELFLQDGYLVADIGCGNGYSCFQFLKHFNITIQGLDYSPEMLKVASKVRDNLPEFKRNRISFSVGDVRKTEFDNDIFDVVITERCLINLITREEQATALKEIYRILKPGGLYLMCEDTEQGLGNLNAIRKLVGLDEIKVRWHNLYLDEAHILSSIESRFELIETRNFSSQYYLASRVINAKLAQEQGLEPSYDSEINRVAALFSSAGDFGDYGPVKLWVLRKI